MFAKGAMAFIQNAGRSNRDVKPVARRSRFIQSVRKMEQACFKEMNRLVRTRMLGGVGGARRKPAPIPIALLCREVCHWVGLDTRDSGDRFSTLYVNVSTV